LVWDCPLAGKTAKGPDYPLGRFVRTLHTARETMVPAVQVAASAYGDSDIVTRAVAIPSAAAGGSLIPEDFAAQVIELLRPATVVRKAGPVVVPMPRGTMRMGKMTAGATGTYGPEGGMIPTSQPSFGDIVVRFKKALSEGGPLSLPALRAVGGLQTTHRSRSPRL